MLRHHAGKVNLTHRNELSPASMFQHERGAAAWMRQSRLRR